MAWTTSPLAQQPAPIGHNQPEKQLSEDEKNALLLNWKSAKTQLNAIKETEMSLRLQVQEAFFPVASRTKGTQRYQLGEGWAVKLVAKYDYKLDGDKVEAALDQIEAQGPGGALIAERLVKFTPTLSQTEYKQLGEVDKPIIDAILTITPATPSLELEEPKVK